MQAEQIGCEGGFLCWPVKVVCAPAETALAIASTKSARQIKVMARVKHNFLEMFTAASQVSRPEGHCTEVCALSGSICQGLL
jgi:hypothetical protein